MTNFCGMVRQRIDYIWYLERVRKVCGEGEVTLVEISHSEKIQVRLRKI